MNTTNVQSMDNPTSVRDVSTRRTGQEFPGLRHETKDVLKQLQANISYLEDLEGRLGFVLGEVRTLIKR